MPDSSLELSTLFTGAAAGAERGEWQGCRWELIGGGTGGRNQSWDERNGHDRARAMAVFQGQIYVGLGALRAEVWRFDGARWEQIGGAGIRGSWSGEAGAKAGAGADGVGLRPDLVWVNVLLADPDGELLYAGVKDAADGAQAWCFDGTSWRKVGGGVGNGDWAAGEQDHLYCLCWHEGQLYAGMQGHMTPFGSARGAAAPTEGERGVRFARLAGYDPSLGNGEVYRYDGVRWSQVAGRGVDDSWDVGHHTSWVYQLASVGGDLYAAVVRHAVRDLRWVGEVWQRRNGRWRHIGGEGIHGTWRPTTTNIVTSLIELDGKLVIGYNCQDYVQRDGRFANHWAWDPAVERWHALGIRVDDERQALIAGQRSFNACVVHNEHLIMGGGGTPGGHLAVWQLAVGDNCWRAIGDADAVARSDAAEWRRGLYAYSMTVFQGALVVGFKVAGDAAQVWRCRSAAGEAPEASASP